ncbi:MAG: hypothetical protein GC200_05790 [Tepidisphaera sp.]|nr:hypothetical protein [Tepidisphaera sp.]
MSDGSTIAAIGSGPGASARALVRVSGPGAPDVARQVLVGVEEVVFASERGCALGHLRLAPWTTSRTRANETLAGVSGSYAAEPLLPVGVIWSRGPRSFTGEDTLELLVPGNPLITSRVMSRVLACPGVRHAEPGEFSARAYLNGRLTLEEAEGVAAGIAANTREELAAARDLSSGRTGAAYAALAQEVATLLALTEAGIDFTDQEDVRAIAPDALRRRIAAVIGDINRLGGGLAPVATQPLVVLAGLPNAGKSTLFNALLGRERAVASPIAGTTRDVLIEPLSLSDGSRHLDVRLADVAGLDAGATGDIAHQADELARQTIAAADLVIHCEPLRARSASEGLPDKRTRDDSLSRTTETLARASGSSVPVLHVRTFADQPAATPDTHLAVCALDGYGLDALRHAIIQRLAGSRSASAAALVPRHAETLRIAAAALHDAASADEPETIAHALRLALDALGQLSGRVTPDDVLGLVFSRFCVGK